MANTLPAPHQPHGMLPAPLEDLIQGLAPSIPALLPADIPLEQFRAALFLELSGRQEIYESSAESLRDCVVKAATYGLLPGRDCHFLPFRNKRRGGKREATFVPNYFGIILALERTGKVRRAFAHPVYEGDEWGFDYFADKPVHKPASSLRKEQGKLLFYYGAVLLKDGTCHFEVLSLKDVDATKRRAPAHEEGPWVTDPIMMGRKTAIKRVAKYARLTPTLARIMGEEEERELTDMSEARHAANIADLFGDMSTQSSAPAPLRPIWANIEEWYAQAGQPENFATLQTWACKRYGVSDIGQIAEHDLEKLAQGVYATLEPLIVERAQAGQAEAEAHHAEVESQPGIPASDDWRIMLAELVSRLQDVSLYQEALSLVGDGGTTDEAGRAMCSRVLWEVEAQESQDSQEALPF